MLPAAYFEELEVGDERMSHRRVVTRTDMDVIPIIFGALHPLFYSDTYAQRVMGRERSQASSLVPLGIVIGLLCQAGVLREAVRLTGWEDLKFFHDPYLGEGDIVRAISTVLSKEPIDEQHGQVCMSVRLLQEEDATVLSGIATAVIRQRAGER